MGADFCIVLPMRTTLDIQDQLLVNAKTVAARERKSLTRLIEEGLRLRLQKKPAVSGGRRHVLPVFKGGGGFQPGIDSLSNRSIYAAAGEDDA